MQFYQCLAIRRDHVQAVVSNPKFLYSAFYTFSNDAVMDFFENQGMPYKIERGNRAFPVSDHASDVIRALERAMKEQDVRICLHTQVRELLIEDDKATGVLLTDGGKIMAEQPDPCDRRTVLSDDRIDRRWSYYGKK